ncbi:uncharacterized protein LOC125668063 isoform X3 [Ostrea edulis]|uniref:uncharacterized protein LOC125668063 isoform X3 n=1 Tax=Ostrea edulis TaxID=37623 RepID=UPI0024AFB4D9|nr:uncharacterized protein LOC125668063 isoform X3 [Ostrea edulis]
MSLKRRDAMRSRRNRQAIPFTTEEHEKINILIDKKQDQRKSHPESGDKLQEIKQMVNEVTIIMKDNIEKVVEREGKLNTLSVRTEELEASPSSSYTSADKQRSSIGYVNESDEVVYRTKKKRISDEGLLHEKDTERTIEAKANRAQEREHSHVRDYAVSIETKSRSSENRGDETLPTTLSASSMKKSIYRSSQSTSSQFQSGEEKGAKQTSVSAVTSPPAFDIYASPAIVDVHPNNSSILSFESDVPPAQSQSAPALMSPIEIDIYNFSKTYNSNIDQNTQLVSLEDVDRQTDEVVLRRKPGISTNEINESEPLQRHNAMRSRKNRSGVAFTDTEKSDIITNVEQTQVQTPAEATSLRKKQHHVSDEVRLQVNEAKLSMEENIAKAEKTEKFLDEMDINPSSKMIRCRSLENIKGTKLTTDTSNGKDYLTKSENMSSMPATSKTGTKEPQLDVKSENKRKNKSATTSTDKSEFKIAYVKKKAKKAKVFLKEKLTYHHSNVEHSKEYRADDKSLLPAVLLFVLHIFHAKME